MRAEVVGWLADVGLDDASVDVDLGVLGQVAGDRLTDELRAGAALAGGPGIELGEQLVRELHQCLRSVDVVDGVR